MRRAKSYPICKVLSGSLAGALGLLILSGSSADARNKREDKNQLASPPPPAATPAPPIISMISLNRQRMYVFDANGMIAQSRVSTGSSGYDTPKGIYSIIGKKEMHESNLYEGAPMPHMQRLLWSGIALHGGEVPNYPASHGCIRLPWGFDKTFFGMTRLNDRVIIVPEVQAPVRVEHPMLFSALPPTDRHYKRALRQGAEQTQVAAVFGEDDALSLTRPKRTIETVMAERLVEEQRLAVVADVAKAELAIAAGRIPALEATLKYARDQVKKAQADEKLHAKPASKALSAARSAKQKFADSAEKLARAVNKTRADKLAAMRADLAKLEQKAQLAADAALKLEGALRSAKAALASYTRQLADAQAKLDAAKAERDVRTADEAETRKALEDYQLAQRNFAKPLSVFISAKTDTISLRQGMTPVMEGPVSISGRPNPLGTYVFTATGWSDNSETRLLWNVVAVNEKGEVTNKRSRDGDASKPLPITDALKAQAALDRILTIPGDVSAKIAELVKPGSTIIISDYDMARSETSQGTDFIVQMPEVIAKYRTPQDIANRKRRSSDPYYVSGFDPATGMPLPGRQVRQLARPRVTYLPPAKQPPAKYKPKWAQATHLPRFFNFQQ